MKQKGLGRGLDAIFGSEHLDARLKPMTEMAEISVSAIFPNPTQPRTEFDEEALEELADSIRTLGVIQPITVKRTDDGRYLIISGERRWRAARKAGLESLPAYIREVDDENLHAMALVENIQREDLNAIEIALGMQRLIDECNLTQEALSEKSAKTLDGVELHAPFETAQRSTTRPSRRGLSRWDTPKRSPELPKSCNCACSKVHPQGTLRAPDRGTGPRTDRPCGKTRSSGRRRGVSRIVCAAGGAARKILLTGDQHQTLEKRRRSHRDRLLRTTGTSTASSKNSRKEALPPKSATINR